MTNLEYGYCLQSGAPVGGRKLEQLRAFLARFDLIFDDGIEFSAVIRNSGDEIVAAASLQGSVIKCVAVDPALQGENLTAPLLTELRQEALRRGRRHLFLYTKPENRFLFTSLGFHAVAAARDVLLMEDRRGGFSEWVERIRRPEAGGVIGSLVMNCDPMTNGHLHLIEQAAAQCGFLYLFILSEDQGAVPAQDRKQIVTDALCGRENIAVAESGHYLISSATFPDYFLKDKNRAGDVWCALDIAVFCRLADLLGITRRFVGTEPFCPTTAAYNRALAALLPSVGIELTEIPRLTCGGTPISASAVRRLLAEDRLADIRPLVPDATFAYLSDPEKRAKLRL